MSNDVSQKLDQIIQGDTLTPEDFDELERLLPTLPPDEKERILSGLSRKPEPAVEVLSDQQKEAISQFEASLKETNSQYKREIVERRENQKGIIEKRTLQPGARILSDSRLSSDEIYLKAEANQIFSAVNQKLRECIAVVEGNRAALSKLRQIASDSIIHEDLRHILLHTLNEPYWRGKLEKKRVGAERESAPVQARPEVKIPEVKPEPVSLDQAVGDLEIADKPDPLLGEPKVSPPAAEQIEKQPPDEARENIERGSLPEIVEQTHQKLKKADVTGVIESDAIVGKPSAAADTVSPAIVDQIKKVSPEEVNPEDFFRALPGSRSLDSGKFANIGPGGVVLEEEGN